MVKKLKEKTLDLLFPKNLVCNICNKESHMPVNGVCDTCYKSLKHKKGIVKLRKVDGFTYAFLFDKTTRDCIHRLKYSNCRYLGEFLAQFISLDEYWKIDFIIPVPLHRRKLRKRGYNQALLIANALGKRLDIEVKSDILIRVKDTKTQTARSKKERSQALLDAFQVVKDIENKTILLIDDVCTTGSTLSECAEVLKHANAVKVYAATVCYTSTLNS